MVADNEQVSEEYINLRRVLLQSISARGMRKKRNVLTQRLEAARNQMLLTLLNGWPTMFLSSPFDNWDRKGVTSNGFTLGKDLHKTQSEIQINRTEEFRELDDAVRKLEVSSLTDAAARSGLDVPQLVDEFFASSNPAMAASIAKFTAAYQAAAVANVQSDDPPIPEMHQIRESYPHTPSKATVIMLDLSDEKMSEPIGVKSFLKKLHIDLRVGQDGGPQFVVVNVDNGIGHVIEEMYMDDIGRAESGQKTEIADWLFACCECPLGPLVTPYVLAG